MDPDRWRRVEALFHRAVALPPSERGALLDAECAGDASLRAEVERLIEADEQPNELVERFDSGALRPPEDPLIGREIGVYRLTARLGVGGMGLVYRAERTDGLFRHEVAIKLIRIEFANENLVRRFELERRTLAALHHPNIAQLHDGGTTLEGRPYLVMELVRGLPIDRYCDEHQLTIDERLELFVQVCRGVHFAHQNLVVHRDLKPGNILVDESGVPKLLDFGIARLLDESANETAVTLTLTGAYLLTPDYASPEQLMQGPVTTSMDVYSLGVLLYELLSGRRPFRSDNKTPLEWHREVLERMPTRPSSMVVAPTSPTAPDPSSQLTPERIASLRGVTSAGLQRQLRGDLDRIVLMALRKEPERRYASAKDLADDIERHFSGQPVQARGDSFTYLATTFVRRNRIAVGSAAAVVVALVLGIVFAMRGERRATEQAQHARIEAESFQGIAEYLMDTFLTSAPGLDQAQLEQKRHRIELHAARLRREYADQDHLRANLLDSLGRVALRLGLYPEAEALVHEASDIRLRAFGPDSLEYALSLRSLGTLLYARGELAPAADALQKALDLHRHHARETHTDVASLANDLAACLRGLGRLHEAEALHLEALALRRQDPHGSLPVAESLNNLAGIDLDRGDLDQASSRLQESLALRRQILGDEDPLTLQSMSNLATTVWRLGRHAEALELLDEVEKGYRALQADGEEALAQVLSNRSAMMIADKQVSAAAPLIDEALELQIRRLGPAHPSVASTLARKADLQESLGDLDGARATWERAIAIRRGAGESPRYLAQALYDYGVFLGRRKLGDEARAAFEEAVGVLRKADLARSSLMAYAQVGWGESLLAHGDVDAAREHLDDAIAIAQGSSAGMEKVLERAQKALERCKPARDG
jgi:serine/threonine-protein kinase